MFKNLSVDEIEKKLDDQILQYNKYSENHPMKGVSYDKSSNRYIADINNNRKKFKLLDNAIIFVKERMEQKIHFIKKNKISKKKNCDKNGMLIKYIYSDEEYYDVLHVLYYFGLKKTSLYDKYTEAKKNIVGYFWHPNIYGGYIIRELISIRTIKLLVKSTHSPSTINLMKLLGINILDYKIPRKETTNSNKIIRVFNQEKIITQKSFGSYKIDLYFSDYKLAIECDEHNHSDRNSKYEKKRQNFLEKNYDITFLRFNPDDPDFDILDVISEIHYQINDFFV